MEYGFAPINTERKPPQITMPIYSLKIKKDFNIQKFTKTVQKK